MMPGLTRTQPHPRRQSSRTRFRYGKIEDDRESSAQLPGKRGPRAARQQRRSEPAANANRRYHVSRVFWQTTPIGTCR